MLDRRQFLLGMTGLITAAFVKKATTYSRTAGEPLILPTFGRTEETLCVYSQDCSSFDAQRRLSLGPYQPFAPPPPTWREHLRSCGRRIDTAEDLEQIAFEMELGPEDLDKPLNGFDWETHGTTSRAPRRRHTIS